MESKIQLNCEENSYENTLEPLQDGGAIVDRLGNKSRTTTLTDLRPREMEDQRGHGPYI